MKWPGANRPIRFKLLCDLFSRSIVYVSNVSCLVHNNQVRLRCSSLSGLLYLFHCKYLLGLRFSIGPCIRVCVWPSCLLSLAPSLHCPVGVRLFRDSVCVTARGGGGRGGRLPNQPLQSPSNRAVWSGTVREEKKDRNIKILNKNRRDREKERGIEKYATSGKSQGLRGLEKRERQIEF